MDIHRVRIKKALLRGEKITRVEAQNLYGVGRLAARIDELSKSMIIQRGWRTLVSAIDGNKIRVREYWV